MTGRHRQSTTSPEHEFSVEHVAAVREIALRLVESSEALLTILDEEIEETVDVTGSLARLQDQLNALLGGDMERRLRSKMGVTREEVVAQPPALDDGDCLLLPDEEEDAKNAPLPEPDPAFPEGRTNENLKADRPGYRTHMLLERQRRQDHSLSRQGKAKQEMRAYYAELAALKRIQRERRELRNLMAEHPFKTNSIRDESVRHTHGTPGRRPKK